MLGQLLVLGASLALIATGAVLIRTAYEIFILGPERISLMRSVGHGLRAYFTGMLGNKRLRSGWRVVAGWHSVSRDGRTKFSNRSKISDEAV